MHDAPRLRQSPPARTLVLLVTFCVSSCGGGGGSSSPPPPSTLSITVSSLPNGQVGHAYSAALTASGGTTPLSWALSGGTLPAGLTLAAATGTITGTPTATAAGTALTFTVNDSSSPPQSKSATLPINISPGSITVTVTPRRAGLTLQQTLPLNVSSNDYAGVSWGVAPAGCGSVNPTSTAGSGSTLFTPGATAGACTVTATSKTDASQSASVAVGVTDLAGVYTYHNDLARDGANTHEYALTPGNVNAASFGKLFSCQVDGAIYAQPLWVANLAIGAGGGHHDVVFVATQHDSLYAFDADADPCVNYWTVSLIDTAHGAAATETSVPSGFAGSLIGQGKGGDIAPEVGVTGTPVIDPANSVLYVVSKSLQSGTSNIYQRLHAIDLATGAEKSGSPVTIAASYPTNASPATFNAGPENQRAGLAFANGAVYSAFASHDDTPSWYGWVLGYTYGASGFGPVTAFNSTPNTYEGGIWMSGGAPSVDNDGNLYVITGNGTLDATSASAPNNDYGDSFLQLKPGSGLQVTSWFAPSDEASDDTNNADFGSGGSAIVLNLSSGTLRHLVVGGGKDGYLYVLNGDSMGNFGDSNAWQRFSAGGPIFATAAFWNNTLYQGVVSGPLSAFAFDPNMSMFNTTAVSQSANSYNYPSPTPSISASGSSNGILWSLDNSNFCTPSDTSSTPCAPTVLYAYDASIPGSGKPLTQLWSSATAAGDAAGYAVKFTVPTVANGKVYVGTRGNDSFNGTTPTIPGELDVYGLKP